QQLTKGADTYYYEAFWSPDSKKLLWSDRMQRLRYVDVASKAVTEVTHNKEGEIESYDWSPDSQWIAWSQPEANFQSKVYLYSAASKKSVPITEDWYGSGRVSFSDDGKYLMFSSSRDFKPTFAEEQFEAIYLDQQRVYLVTLSKDTESPLAPRSDEVGKKEKEKKEDEKEGGKKEEKKEKKPMTVKVDLDGIQNRIVGLDITPANYKDLRLVKDRVFYVRRTVGDNSGQDEEEEGPEKQKWHLCSYSLEDRKETVLGDVNSYQISLDGEKMLVKIDQDYSIIDLPKDKLETKDHKLEVSGLDVMADRRAEWRQMYFESWRQMRDFFFSPTMNGIDWKAMRDKYAALLPYVIHRNDLTYLIGELIGELNNGHAYVGGGERPDTPRIKLGLLG